MMYHLFERKVMQATPDEEPHVNVTTRHSKKKRVVDDDEEEEDESTQWQGGAIGGADGSSGGVAVVAQEDVQMEEDVEMEEDVQTEKDRLLGELSDDDGDTKVTSNYIETVESTRPESPNAELEFIFSLE